MEISFSNLVRFVLVLGLRTRMWTMKMLVIRLRTEERSLQMLPEFEKQLAVIDTRQRACFCDSCNKTCGSRAAYENHLVSEHKIESDS